MSKVTAQSRPGRRLPVALAVVAVAALAGCSSSAASSSGAQTAGSGSSKQPIVVGSIQTLSGADGQAPAGEAATAWAKWTNAHGGINGHPVKLVLRDDAGSPTQALTDAKEMVQQDHALAIAGSHLANGAAVTAYAEQTGLPLVGGLLAEVYATGDPNAFPASTTQAAITYGELDAAKLAGANKTSNLYCAEYAACAQGVPIFSADNQQLGMTAVYQGQVSASAPSYAAPCLAAKNSGANALGVGADPQVTLKVYQACAQQGYSPVKFSSDIAISSNFAQSSIMDGLVLADTQFPWTEGSTAARKAYLDALTQYEPSIFSDPSYGAVEASVWAGLELFKAAAVAGHVTPTSGYADLVNGMYALPAGDTLGGIAPPLTFKRGDKNHLVNCYYVSELKSGKWLQPFGAQARCEP